jgi:hypothetical protein
VVPQQTVAALLLIGSDGAVAEDSPSLGQMFTLLSQPATAPSIAGGTHAPILRALLERWVTAANSIGSSYGMMLALKYDLKEAALLHAKKLIGQGTSSPSMLQYAMIAIGKFGGKEDIPLLMPLLKNKTVCHRWSNPQLKKDGPIKIEIRDTALVILLRMTGKDPSEFGFNLLRENPDTLYHLYTFGFVDEKQREAAHARWAELSEASRR